MDFTGVWVWVTLLPTFIVNSKTVDSELCIWDYVGWSLWLVGMLIECLADYQKYVFRGVSANKYVNIQKVLHFYLHVYMSGISG